MLNKEVDQLDYGELLEFAINGKKQNVYFLLNSLFCLSENSWEMDKGDFMVNYFKKCFKTKFTFKKEADNKFINEIITIFIIIQFYYFILIFFISMLNFFLNIIDFGFIFTKKIFIHLKFLIIFKYFNFSTGSTFSNTAITSKSSSKEVSKEFNIIDSNDSITNNFYYIFKASHFTK